jgi:hypothetical protein
VGGIEPACCVLVVAGQKASVQVSDTFDLPATTFRDRWGPEKHALVAPSRPRHALTQIGCGSLNNSERRYQTLSVIRDAPEDECTPTAAVVERQRFRYSTESFSFFMMTSTPE